MCPNLGGFGEKFYSNGSRAVLLIRISCVQDLHSFNPVSDGLLMTFCGSQGYQTVTFSLELRMLHQVVNIFHLLGALVLQKSSKILCVSLEAEPGSCPKAPLLPLDWTSLVSASPPFPDYQLLEPALELREGQKCGTQKGSHAQKPHSFLLGFTSESCPLIESLELFQLRDFHLIIVMIYSTGEYLLISLPITIPNTLKDTWDEEIKNHNA